ncbi:hypothetical protein [uncultured Acetobacteroides sp.]|uniref:hypothetical protein n=1 Tax=uncultured Acetobacteroides sp. TaxID=1760811 RepID=UPI0029F4FD95|nr:hypothetical protein [uncultured Acetobacteroides sp.]
MKTTKQIFALLLTLAVLAMGCKKDDEPFTPTVSFEKDAIQVYENQSGDVRVKINLSAPAEKQLTIPIEITGTAVNGTNYVISDAENVTISAGASSGEIILQPSISATADDYTLTVTLKQAAGFIVDPTKNAVTVTIMDSQKSNLTKVSFVNTNEVLTNPLLAETIDVKVALSEALSKDIVVPLSFIGAVEGTDFTTEGLDGGSIRIPANALEATFKVKVKSADITQEKKLEINFAGDSQEFIVDNTRKTATVTLINPEVDFTTSFFNANNIFKNFSLSNGTATQFDTKTAYRIKTLIWDMTTNAFKSTGEHWVNLDKRNAWKPEVHTWFKKAGWTSSITVETERWEILTKNLLNISDYFPAGYIVKYGNVTTGFINDSFIKFIPTQRDGMKGVAIIPSQDVTLYKSKAGYDWFGTTTVNGKTVTNWYTDSKQTSGAISQSTNVEPVIVKIESINGSYDLTTSTISMDIILQCSDSNFAPTANYIVKNENGKYTIRYQFTQAVIK